MKGIDWLKIKNEYISGNISQRDLAKKYHISDSTLTKRANKEKWQQEKATQGNIIALKLQQETADAIVKNEINRINRILSISDKLTDKLELAAEQLDSYLVTNKLKIKTVQQGNKTLGTPLKEITKETENIAILNGIIDKAGLKQLAGALKDIKDVQTGYEQSGNATETDPLTKSLQELAQELNHDK